MSSILARQAIRRSLANYLAEICLHDIDDNDLPWPRSLNDVVQQLPPLSPHPIVSRPTITIALLKIDVPVNGIVTEQVKAYRISFAFRGLSFTQRSLYIDLPTQCRRNRVSEILGRPLRLEIYQWLSDRPRINSLMIRRVRNMHDQMRRLVNGLTDAQFNITQFDPASQPGTERTVTLSNGGLVARVHSATQVMFRIRTDNGCRYEELIPRQPALSPQQLRARLHHRYQV